MAADPHAELRERLRRNPPTPIGVTATLGGPRPGLEQAGEVQAGRPAPPSTLGTAAEIAASAAAPGVVGPVVGRAAGALLPRLAAKGAEILARVGSAAGAGVGVSEAFAPSGETPEEVTARRTRAALEGGAGEAIAPAVKAGAGMIVRPFRRRLTPLRVEELLEPGSAEAQVLLRASGGTLTPGQFKKGFLLDTAENIAEASFFGGGLVRRTRARGAAAAVAALDDAAPKVVAALDPEQAGTLLAEAIQNSADAQRMFTRAAYGALDAKILESGGGGVVDITPVLQHANELLDIAIRANDPAAVAIERVLRGFAGTPVSFQQADKIRSLLLDLSRSEQALIPGVKRLAGALAQDTEQAIRAAGLRLGPLGQDVLDAFATARSTSRLGHEVFNDRLIAELVGKKAPEDLARALFQADKPSRIAAVRRIVFEPKYREAVGNPNQLWGEVQASFLATLRRTKGQQGEFGELSGKALGKALDSSHGTFRELFPDPVQRNSLRIAARALELAQGPAGGTGSGRIFMQLTQAGTAIRGLQWVLGVGPAQPGTEEVGVQAGVVLLGPAVLATVLTRPKFASFLLRRAQTKEARAGRATGAVLAQTISHLIDENVPFTYLDNSGIETQHVPTPGAVPSRPFSFKPQSKQ